MHYLSENYLSLKNTLYYIDLSKKYNNDISYSIYEKFLYITINILFSISI